MANSKYRIEVIRSQRKTIGIQIKGPELVVVRAPMKATQITIDEVLKQKNHWIEKHISQWAKDAHKVDPLDYKEGALWQIVGTTYQLTYVIDSRSNKYILRLNEGQLQLAVPTMNINMVRKLLYQFVHRKLLNYVYERIDFYKAILEVEINRVVIKKQKTLWGSCSSHRNININIMVAFAPVSVIDYLLVHELCHLIEMNHSQKYWRLVASICPEYKEKRQWLKAHNYLLEPSYF